MGEAQNVGARVRQLREERGLSLRGLAELCGISPNTVSLIERGASSPSVDTPVSYTHLTLPTMQ